jgi:hypothetical protein
MVSPIPIQSRFPRPIADFTVPVVSPPASVIPRWIGASVASASPCYAAAARKTSEAFTLILNSWKSLSSRMRI